MLTTSWASLPRAMPWAANGTVCCGVGLDTAVSWTGGFAGKATKFTGQANGRATMLVGEMPSFARVVGRFADRVVGSNDKAGLLKMDESGAG